MSKPGFAMAIIEAKKKSQGSPAPDDEESSPDDATDDEVETAAFDEFAHAMKSGDHEAGLAALKSIINGCMAYGQGEN